MNRIDPRTVEYHTTAGRLTLSPGGGPRGEGLRGPGLPPTTAPDALPPARLAEARRLTDAAAAELGVGGPVAISWYRRLGPAAPAAAHRDVDGVARLDPTGRTAPGIYLAEDLEGPELARVVGHELYHLREFRRGVPASPAQEVAAERFAHDFATRRAARRAPRAPAPGAVSPMGEAEDWRADAQWRARRLAVLQGMGHDWTWEYTDLLRRERLAQEAAAARGSGRRTTG